MHITVIVVQTTLLSACVHRLMISNYRNINNRIAQDLIIY